jgi:NAD(P)H-nitrite reductase large subunit
MMTGTGLIGLDPARSRVSLRDGGELASDRLLLATGAEPRRISIAGADLSGVHYLRTLADCDALRDLPRVHLENGVRLIAGTGIERFEAAGAVHQVRTSDGTAIDCDFVLVGIGVAPRTGLAEAAGLRTDNGIVADQALATKAGLIAIEELTPRGVNVNVTLLFAVSRYEQVIDAYQRGLDARAKTGEPLGEIASVASFFPRGSIPRSTRSCPRTRRCAAASRSPTRGSLTGATQPSSPVPVGSA